MKNSLLLLCLIFFPFYTQAQIVWKNLAQPQGLLAPCSIYTGNKKLISCGFIDIDLMIRYDYF